MAEDSEYALEPLREGAVFTLFRGNKRRDRMPILAIAVAAEGSSPQSLRRLEHEYALASEIDPGWAAQPLALTRHQGRPALILKDPGGQPLDRIVEHHTEKPIELSRFLRIAIGFAGALGAVHRQGLIHKDIKPAHALVDDSGRVWLTGFGIASRLARERQSPKAPEFIAGSLPYMAPEQTGRMNRSIDSRSDLYSLGVTLYEMATGGLPFTAADPMEWVHCHIARQAPALRERAPAIPGQVSAIIMKLLAKIAEDRYQTAAGLQRDLQRCLAEFETHGRIDEFPLGDRDTSAQLLIPEKLYGRESEIQTLLASFERVAAGGRPELVLVSGYSGVGKSSVVNELHKPLVLPRGVFASGKFDQYKRDSPYATIAQAFQSLIRPILAQDEAELDRWRDALREALGPNGQLMVDLVPELKLIIGEQQPVPELPPQDAQRRFHVVFRRFIGAFTREHPLVLFLDDLQWLDANTLELMEDVLTHPDVSDVLLIGAYRDNEVTPAHPLMRKLHVMRQAAIVHDIVLAPLKHDDLERLMVDALHCEPARAAPLAELVEEKTSGNPFFAIQFLTALFEAGLLAFDHVEGRWCWNLNRIRAEGYTDNVVDLVVAKLHRLSAGTQQALQQLACLGNSADFALLRMVYGDGSEALHEQLWEAVRTGLIFRSDDAYRFLHDRVQEAAYSLIPQDSRAAAHLRIGTSMASHLSADVEERIFEIVNHLNRGWQLITSTLERERMAELNLIAGRRAKSSTAYASALTYLYAGRRLLTDETWNRNGELIFSLEYLLAECELLTADLTAAENRLSRLAERANHDHDRALVACLRVTLYNVLGSKRGVDIFIEYQRDRGNDWSPHPTDADVSREYDRIWSLLGTRQIEELIDLRVMTDPDVLDTLNVFTEIVLSAMVTDENLHALVLCRMVSLSLEHGNSDASCLAYVALGILAGPQFGNDRAGFRFSKLGYDLVEKHGFHRYQARVYLRFANQVLPWWRHVKAGRELVRRALEAAEAGGDLPSAAFSYNNLITNLLASGDPLADVRREAQTGLEFAKNVGYGRVADQIATQLALVRTLRGSTATFGSFDDADFDELAFERHLSADPMLARPACQYWIRKLQARFFAGDHASAMQASMHAGRLLQTSHTYFEVAEYQFYSALVRAAAFDSAPEHAQREHVEALAGHHRQLEIWTETCAENFENRAALVGAEIARIEGRDGDAMRSYEQAIRSAHANGFVHNEALANELAGRFYLGRGIETAGYSYLGNAWTAYDRWGATGKLKQLDQMYPRLRESRTHAASLTIGPPAGQLDVETVAKASQALSSEIVLPMLIERLMRIAVEHAGAERGVLILVRSGEPFIEAEATTGPGGIEVAVREEAVTPSAIPQSALHYVIRTQGRVLLDDAAAHNAYSADDYVRVKRPRSVLCLPIVKQATLIGALYLENNLTPFVFTPDRVTVLELLASQAAISLENAALYSDLQERETKVRTLIDSNFIGILIGNVDGHVQEANEAFLQMLGYDRADLAAGRLRRAELTPPEWHDRDAQGLVEMISAGTSMPYEKEYFRKDGSRVPVLVGGATFGERRHSIIAFIVDLTERKRAEAELAHANRVATMGQLTASIAHEVGQPVTGLLLSAQSAIRHLADLPPNVEQARRLTERIIRDAQRTADIVSRIRDFSKKAPARTAELGINEVILEIVGLTRGPMSDHGVSAKIQLADGLPDILGDRVRLQQVILNLMMNAIEAMSEIGKGSRELSISTSETETGSVLVAVGDTGPGLPAASLAQIFEAFYTTKPSGLGMGLSISRSIVQTHGGRLWAEPNKPCGAVFSFTLPTGGK